MRCYSYVQMLYRHQHQLFFTMQNNQCVFVFLESCSRVNLLPNSEHSFQHLNACVLSCTDQKVVFIWCIINAISLGGLLFKEDCLWRVS